MTKPDADRSPLGVLVKDLREAAGLSQAALADRTEGVSSGLVGLIETGKRSGSYETVEALADALDVSGDDRQRLHSARRASKGGGNHVIVQAGTATATGTANPRGIKTLDQRFEDLSPKQRAVIEAAFDAFEADR